MHWRNRAMMLVYCYYALASPCNDVSLLLRLDQSTTSIRFAQKHLSMHCLSLHPWHGSLITYPLRVYARPNWQMEAWCPQPVHLFIHVPSLSVTKLGTMNEPIMMPILVQMIHVERALNYPLWQSWGQSSRSHKPKDRFADTAKASLSTLLEQVGFWVATEHHSDLSWT